LVVRARSFTVAEQLSRLHRRVGHHPGISRERLLALLDGGGRDPGNGGAPESRPRSSERTTPRSGP
ncbi:MAG TPA: hypothetical protein VHH09_07435, partial [Acidimicrobiales bacterium]|nr:hypothetical protein [Acidimicrobiales bacterium]